MSTLYVDNLQPNLGSGVHIPGHVVQTKTLKTTSSLTSTSTTYIDVLDFDFTPVYDNSVLLVSGALSGIAYEAQTAYSGSQWQYTVTPSGGSTTSGLINYYMMHYPAGAYYGGQIPLSFDYTVTSTVSHTIKVQALSRGGRSNAFRNRNGESSVMVIQEIAQ